MNNENKLFYVACEGCKHFYNKLCRGLEFLSQYATALQTFMRARVLVTFSTYTKNLYQTFLNDLTLQHTDIPFMSRQNVTLVHSMVSCFHSCPVVFFLLLFYPCLIARSFLFAIMNFISPLPCTVVLFIFMYPFNIALLLLVSHVACILFKPLI